MPVNHRDIGYLYPPDPPDNVADINDWTCPDCDYSGYVEAGVTTERSYGFRNYRFQRFDVVCPECEEEHEWTNEPEDEDDIY